MTTESNEVRIVGIRPAHNTDDFPVSQADKDLLKMTIHLMAYHQPTTTWKKVLCDANGKLIINPTAPLSFHQSAFLPQKDNCSYEVNQFWLSNRNVLTSQIFLCSVCLPNGCTVTKVTLYGYRNDALATMGLALIRTDHADNEVLMASVVAAWIDGYNSGYDDSILSPVVDNVNCQYVLTVGMDPNDSVYDVLLTGAKIEFTG